MMCVCVLLRLRNAPKRFISMERREIIIFSNFYYRKRYIKEIPKEFSPYLREHFYALAHSFPAEASLIT